MTPETERVLATLMEAVTDIVEHIDDVELAKKYQAHMKELAAEAELPVLAHGLPEPRKSMPAVFTGSEEERLANRETHHWTQMFDGEVVCMDCDRKSWHIGADYPCREPVPRVDL